MPSTSGPVHLTPRGGARWKRQRLERTRSRTGRQVDIAPSRHHDVFLDPDEFAKYERLPLLINPPHSVRYSARLPGPTGPYNMSLREHADVTGFTGTDCLRLTINYRPISALSHARTPRGIVDITA
ncbi:hypothetical protein Bbelb_133980 [Branchiostoma belcheri]|nr:hypothetical protein Bbelb_133980 [Branchiostoma belcheri]